MPLRIVAIVVGVATAYPVFTGAMAFPIFVVADLILGAALLLAALLPARLAPAGLLAANGYAIGVYTVALAGYFDRGQAVNPLLIGVMAGTIGSLIALAAMAVRGR